MPLAEVRTPRLWHQDVWEQRSLFELFVLLGLMPGVAPVPRAAGASQSPWLEKKKGPQWLSCALVHPLLPTRHATLCVIVAPAEAGNRRGPAQFISTAPRPPQSLWLTGRGKGRATLVIFSPAIAPKGQISGYRAARLAEENRRVGVLPGKDRGRTEWP